MTLDASWDEELEAGYVYLPDHPGRRHAGLCGPIDRRVRAG